MAKAVVTAEEFGALDKVLQAEYEAPGADGTRKLRVEKAGGLELANVETTLQSLSRERTLREKHEKTLAAMVDDEGNPFEPSKVRNAIKKYSEMSNWKPDDKVREQIDAMKAQLEDRYGTEAKTLKEQIAELERGLDESVVDAALNAQIAKHGANRKIAAVLKPMLKRYRDESSKRYGVQIMDEGGIPKLSAANSGKPMAMDEYFESLKKDPEFQVFFPGTPTSGPGGLSPNRITANTGPGQFRMSNADAKKDVRAYEAMRAEAAKAGKSVELHD